jgi:LCP family protein required for cell wall assembly
MGVPHLKIDLHRAVLGAVLVSLLAGCTFAAPLGSPGPSGVAGPTVALTAQPDDTPGPDATSTPDATRTPRPNTTPRPTATRTPKSTKAPTPAPTKQAGIPGLDHLLGSDGRFTMLLLGVDSRTRQINGRTDTIMFVTIDPNTGKVSMASLPRDMVLVPIANGKTFGSKYTRINALFAYLGGFGGGRKAQFKRMVAAMEYMSGIEIDRYAMIGFYGVRNLINNIGGVNVTLARPLIDNSMHVRMKGGTGLKLKAGANHLTGPVALAFARTRHTDSDYERARRQQQLIVAALKKVIKQGPAALPKLVAHFPGEVKTDIAFSDAPALLALASRAKLNTFKSTVLGPSKYAGPGDMQYATKLKIDVVRQFFQNQFGPVKH